MKIKRYRLLQMPFLAFFSKRFYREVGYNWKGANFIYLFLLLAICCIPAALNVRKNMLTSLQTNQLEFINQIPEIQIRKGIVYTEQNKPQYIRRADGSPFMIIDTTGSMNYIDDDHTMALLTETGLIVRYGPNHFNTFDLSGVQNLNIDKYVFNHWIQMAKSTIAPLSYGIFLLLSFLCTVVTLLCVSVIGLVLATLLHNPLGFSGALRIASVASTPAILFITLSATFGSVLSPNFLISFALGLTVLYVFIGILACSRLADADSEAIDLKAFLHEAEESIEDVAA